MEIHGTTSSYKAEKLILRDCAESRVFTTFGRQVISGMVSGEKERRARTIAAIASGRGRDATNKRPLVIVGLPRSGTTALHLALAADDRFKHLPQWAGRHVMPVNPAADPWTYPECRMTHQQNQQTAKFLPDISRYHVTYADSAEQCCTIMTQMLVSTAIGQQFALPRYLEWLGSLADMDPEYQFYRAALAVVGAKDVFRPWVLKCTHHGYGIESMKHIFPDARFVWIQRDSEEILQSATRLVKAGLNGIEVDVDQREPEIYERLRHSFCIARSRLEAAMDENWLTVSRDHFLKRPQYILDHIYEFAGMASRPLQRYLKQPIFRNS